MFVFLGAYKEKRMRGGRHMLLRNHTCVQEMEWNRLREESLTMRVKWKSICSSVTTYDQEKSQTGKETVAYLNA